MSFEELLKSLQQDYLSALPAKMENIRKQIAASDVPALRESFHKFKGTGRTYGLPEISELAEVVESICINKPALAATAAGHALESLKAIHEARSAKKDFQLLTDPAFQRIQKLLQN